MVGKFGRGGCNAFCFMKERREADSTKEKA